MGVVPEQRYFLGSLGLWGGVDGTRRWDDDALNHVLCMCYGDTIAFFGTWLSEWGLLGCGSASGFKLCDVMNGLFAKNSAGRRRVWVGWTDGMHREGVVLMYG